MKTEAGKYERTRSKGPFGMPSLSGAQGWIMVPVVSVMSFILRLFFDAEINTLHTLEVYNNKWCSCPIRSMQFLYFCHSPKTCRISIVGHSSCWPECEFECLVVSQCGPLMDELMNCPGCILAPPLDHDCCVVVRPTKKKGDDSFRGLSAV